MSAWPTSPGPTSAKIGSLYPTLVSTAQSLKRQVRSRGGQRWKIDLSYQNMTRAQFAPIWAQVLAMRGQYNTATLSLALLPGYDAPRGAWGGSALVDGASQVGYALNIKGLTHGITGIGKAGDFIRLAGTKVYMLVADMNSDSSGKAVASIEPALVVSPADNESVATSNVAFTVAAAADLAEFPVKPPLLHDFSISLVEAY